MSVISYLCDVCFARCTAMHFPLFHFSGTHIFFSHFFCVHVVFAHFSVVHIFFLLTYFFFANCLWYCDSLYITFITALCCIFSVMCFVMHFLCNVLSLPRCSGVSFCLFFFVALLISSFLSHWFAIRFSSHYVVMHFLICGYPQILFPFCHFFVIQVALGFIFLFSSCSVISVFVFPFNSSPLFFCWVVVATLPSFRSIGSFTSLWCFTACMVNGTLYQSGEEFMASDNCRECECNDGIVACAQDICSKSFYVIFFTFLFFLTLKDLWGWRLCRYTTIT